MPHLRPLLGKKHISMCRQIAKTDLHILNPIPSLPADALLSASSLTTTTLSTTYGSHSPAPPSTFCTSPVIVYPLLRDGGGGSDGLDADATCSNRAITAHIRNGDLVSAFHVFEVMPIKTTFSWNLILAGYSKKAGYLKEAIQLFARIPRPDIVSFNTMLSCYFRNDDVSGAHLLFDSMPLKDFASWNSMISGLAQNGRMNSAQELFLGMPEKNDVSWNAIVSGYVQIGDMDMAEEYFNKAPNMNDVILKTSMITGYMSKGNIIKAQYLFDQMLSKNLVTWNAMVAGYVENHRSEEGVNFFKRMLNGTGMRPNSSTFSSALLACSNLSALELGRQIHQFSCKLPLYFDVTVGTSLLSMYCKCGDLANARRLFNLMYRRDVVAWNAMISGYAQHGLGEKAMELFDHMVRLGVRPDWITFVAVLSACNHTGMIQLGIHYFKSMRGDYNVEHRSEHYTCMVDLLCRAGSLIEAAKLISSMPSRPHQAVYGILLGACKIHKNLDLAEFAAEKLFELEPRNAGAYIQLANVYATLNRWDDVSRVRMLMKANRIVKAPGYSWIEVRSVVHEFRSGDRLHPQLDMIIKKLKDLEIKIKQAGYTPDLNSALHDVEDDMKEQILLHHSEKLAIAFGLISTTPRILIRVFKNLRMCTDCHAATKFISSVEKRDIIVRDTTRFHHFSSGECSCGDYW